MYDLLYQKAASVLLHQDGMPSTFMKFSKTQIGNVTVIQSDLPSSVNALIFPLCADTVAAAMESPSPYPPVSELRD